MCLVYHIRGVGSITHTTVIVLSIYIMLEKYVEKIDQDFSEAIMVVMAQVGSSPGKQNPRKYKGNASPQRSPCELVLCTRGLTHEIRPIFSLSLAADCTKLQHFDCLKINATHSSFLKLGNFPPPVLGERGVHWRSNPRP